MVIRLVVNPPAKENPTATVEKTKIAAAPTRTSSGTVRGKLLAEQRFPAAPAATYQVCARVVDKKESASTRAVLLGLRFLDAEERVIDTPLARWTFSKRYEQWVMYLRSGKQAGEESVSYPFVVPEGTALLDIKLYRWQGSAAVHIDGDIVLRKEKESVESLRKQERDSPRIASMVCQNILDEGVEDVAMLEYIFEFAWRHGHASLLRRAAAALLTLDAKHIDRQSILLRLDELREQDPIWLPVSSRRDAGQAARRKSPVSRRPHYVAHLCGGLWDESSGNAGRVANIVRHHPADRVRPILVTPAEYVHAEAPEGRPWVEREHADVPLFHLTCLNTSMLESLERTRMMELDVVLATHICRQNQTSIIHAHAGRRGHDLALRGHAIASHFQIPVVYEAREPLGAGGGKTSWGTDSELATLRRDQQGRCMHLATAVVTGDEPTKAALVEYGIDKEKIFVVPEPLLIPALADAAPAHASSDSLPGRIGMIARSVPGAILPELLNSLRSARKMQLAIYGNNQELTLWRTIAAQHSRIEVIYIEGEERDDAKALEFLGSLQCLVLPEITEHWNERQLSCWGLKAMALGVPLVEMNNSGVFGDLAWRDKKIVLTADWPALPRLVHGIAAGTVAVKSMAKRAREWACSTRHPATIAQHYEAVYDYAMGHARSRTILARKRAAGR